MLICAFGLFSMVSCSNDSNNPTDTTQIIIENNTQSGTWRITEFIDSGNNETNHFNGFNFTFDNNGTLTAQNGSTIYIGSWNISDSNSSDDSKDDLDLNINFNLTNDFESLNEDWSFISQSSNRIELTHVSGGGGGTDFLTFEKN